MVAQNAMRTFGFECTAEQVCLLESAWAAGGRASRACALIHTVLSYQVSAWLRALDVDHVGSLDLKSFATLVRDARIALGGAGKTHVDEVGVVFLVRARRAQRSPAGDVVAA